MNGTYLNLSHVLFKDQPQAIDDWAQSLSIIITNYKISWSKEKFLDYIAATLQGDVLQWLRQWEKSEIGKSQKTALLTNFLTLDTILAEFAKIIKENLCGFAGDTNLQTDANYI